MGSGKTESRVTATAVCGPLLVRQGWEVNVKRIHRLYKAEGMMVRRLKRKRLIRTVPLNPLLCAGESGMGHGLRVGCTGNGAVGCERSTVIDSYTKEFPGNRGGAPDLQQAGNTSAGALDGSSGVTRRDSV